MDTLILYKAYRQYLAETPRKRFGDCYPQKDKHMDMISSIVNSIEQTKEDFCTVMVALVHTFPRRMKEGCRLIYDPKVGGSYYVYSDDYYTALEQTKQLWQKAERLYSFILDDEKEIARQYALIEQEKDAELLRQIHLKEFLNTPLEPIKSTFQLLLF